ncbi:MAG: flagellar hook capping FlgD N-terminal domain-containing protein [Roseicyclus sp.]
MDALSSTTRPDANPRSAPSEAEEAQTVITADFETFLQLLTTQMKNQDPLNPMESQEFATQLATFSGVEQQVRTNQLLESLSTGFGTLGMGQIGGWIGMEAMVEGPTVFTGTPVAFQSTPADGADRTELVVTDPDGTVMQRIPIPLTDATMEWSGTDAQGRSLPAGTYEFLVESWSGEELLDTRPATIRATIEEAQMEDGRTVLTLAGGTRVPAEDILGISRPPPQG